MCLAGGWNSICETAIAGKPMLIYSGLWWDQPINAQIMANRTRPSAIAAVPAIPERISRQLASADYGTLERQVACFMNSLGELQRNATSLRSCLNGQGRVDHNRALSSLVAYVTTRSG